MSTWGDKSFHIDTRTDRVTPLGHAKSEPNALGSDIITSGWQQSDGTIWLGTGNGLAYTNPERALYDVYDLEALFPALTDERGIISFAEDPDGSWWLGTSIRGLLHYVPVTNRLDVYRLPGKTAQYPWGLPITGIDQRGNELLVGSDTAVYRFNKQTRQFQVRQTLLDRRGNLWPDIHPEGFARFSAQKKEFIVTDTYRADYEITLNSLTEDRDGSFLMATGMDGLVTYDPVRRRDTVRVENEAMTLSQCTAARTDRNPCC